MITGYLFWQVIRIPTQDIEINFFEQLIGLTDAF